MDRLHAAERGPRLYMEQLSGARRVHGAAMGLLGGGGAWIS